MNRPTITKATPGQRPFITALLQAESLPADDLPVSLDNFFVATEDNRVIGAIGLEPYQQYGLLRSMVVSKEHRNQNIAAQLVQQLEAYAAARDIRQLYLLTQTAAPYFEKKGYETINRQEVPDVVKASSEFSHVCPASAIVMKKTIA